MAEMVVGVIIFIIGGVFGFLIKAKADWSFDTVEQIDLDKPVGKKLVKELKRDDLSEFDGVMSGANGYKCFDVDKMMFAADEEGDE